MSTAAKPHKADVQEALDMERLGHFGQTATILSESGRADMGNIEILDAFLRNLGLHFEPQRDQVYTDNYVPVDLKQMSDRMNTFGVLSNVPRLLLKTPYHVPILLIAADTCLREEMYPH